MSRAGQVHVSAARTEGALIGQRRRQLRATFIGPWKKKGYRVPILKPDPREAISIGKGRLTSFNASSKRL